jgi:hypothetical protein
LYFPFFFDSSSFLFHPFISFYSFLPTLFTSLSISPLSHAPHHIALTAPEGATVQADTDEREEIPAVTCAARP